MRTLDDYKYNYIERLALVSECGKSEEEAHVDVSGQKGKTTVWILGRQILRCWELRS
jgi:hypothetical protein